MLYLLRHIKTTNNQKQIVSGRSDAEFVDNSFEKLLPITIQFDDILTSPSQRCIKTVEYMTRTSAAYHLDNRLMERNMGVFEGRSKAELAKDYPHLFYTYEGSCVFRFEKTPPKGEPFQSFFKRVQEFYNDYSYKVRDPNEKILVCSHNQTLKLLYFVSSRLAITDKGWTNLNFENGKLYHIDVKL